MLDQVPKVSAGSCQQFVVDAVKISNIRLQKHKKLSYRKQIARHLRTHHVVGIYSL